MPRSLSICSIKPVANLHGVRNPPDGFLYWAIHEKQAECLRVPIQMQANFDFAPDFAPTNRAPRGQLETGTAPRLIFFLLVANGRCW